MNIPLHIYLVGGAVRDQLLGHPIHERDWVVVGATPDTMLKLGYRPVGKDFPVFLHPQTHEEYALARTERKTAPGYQGFVFHASPEVTLEEDLKRRDLTINAIAQDTEGHLIDPFHGQEDLKNKLFRHVSSAFLEDPVRMLRVARFAARFSDFTVHPDTQQLMQEMVKNGEVDALVAERVWQEWAKALSENAPHRFFEVLADCGGLSVLFPAFNAFSLEALARATKLSPNSAIRLAALLHSLSVDAIDDMAKRYRIPSDYHDLARLASKYVSIYPNIPNYDAEELLQVLESLDVFRRPSRFQDFLLVCEAIYPADQHSADRLKKAFDAAQKISAEKFVAQGLTGKAIGAARREERVKAIKDAF